MYINKNGCFERHNINRKEAGGFTYSPLHRHILHNLKSDVCEKAGSSCLLLQRKTKEKKKKKNCKRITFHVYKHSQFRKILYSNFSLEKWTSVLSRTIYKTTMCFGPFRFATSINLDVRVHSQETPNLSLV